MCGEENESKGGDLHRLGSPPRVRGREIIMLKEAINRRITPACAGKSAAPQRQPVHHLDHPRVCGEEPPPTRPSWTAWGSPPRVRGRAFLVHLPQYLHRITPACAGKSAPATRSTPCPGDHPRVCGEELEIPDVQLPGEGSPPRVRGRGSLSEEERKEIRITPACAGKSSTASTGKYPP